MRRSSRAVPLMVSMAFLLLTLPTWGHHGDAGRYNDHVTTITGTVAQWRLINPHSVLILDVPDGSGNVVRWRGELGNPSALGTRHGWDENTFKPGDQLQMTGRALRNGSPSMTLSEGSVLVDMATGEELYRGN